MILIKAKTLKINIYDNYIIEVILYFRIFTNKKALFEGFSLN